MSQSVHPEKNNVEDIIANIAKMAQEMQQKSKEIDDALKKQQDMLKVKMESTLWVRKQPFKKRLWWWLTGGPRLSSVQINPETNKLTFSINN